MATRSTIALELNDGTIKAIYCHWDGGISNNGKILQQHYTDVSKVQALIDNGDLSILGEEIGVKRPFSNPHKYDSIEYLAFEEKYKHQCVFYGRDRGETDIDAKTFANFEEYLEKLPAEEYNYILRNDGHWYVDYDGEIVRLDSIEEEVNG